MQHDPPLPNQRGNANRKGLSIPFLATHNLNCCVLGRFASNLNDIMTTQPTHRQWLSDRSDGVKIPNNFDLGQTTQYPEFTPGCKIRKLFRTSLHPGVKSQTQDGEGIKRYFTHFTPYSLERYVREGAGPCGRGFTLQSLGVKCVKSPFSFTPACDYEFTPGCKLGTPGCKLGGVC